jgi:cell wall-associated NlpC family hydrolase
MSHFGREVSKGDLEPGDLLFFKGLIFIDHTGIYMGNGYFIHCQSGVGVNYTRLDAPYFAAHFAGAKRVI